MSKFTKSIDRIDTFSDPDYHEMLDELNNSQNLTNNNNNNFNNDDDELIDEETINWKRLCTRVLAFFLLFLIILFLCLGGISKKFFALAGIICIILVLIIINTYVKLIHYLPCYPKERKQQETDPLRQSITGINTIFGFKFYNSKKQNDNETTSNYVPPTINPILNNKDDFNL